MRVAGLETVPFHTSDTIMRIDEVPGHLVIIGGGFIAAEMSHVFGTFGAEVTVIGRSSRVLSHEDWEIGTRFRTGARRADRPAGQRDGHLLVEPMPARVVALLRRFGGGGRHPAGGRRTCPNAGTNWPWNAPGCASTSMAM